MFTYINVSRSTHCAIYNLTGDLSSRASPDAIFRRARYGYLLAFHILLLCAVGRTPTEIAAFLFCSRSSVYRIVRVYRAGRLGIPLNEDGQLSIAIQSTIFDALAHALAGRHTQKSPTGLWLVPHPVELCDPRRHSPGQTRS